MNGINSHGPLKAWFEFAFNIKLLRSSATLIRPMRPTSETCILFLGAGKRLSLLERFAESANAENISLKLWATELRKNVPICRIAEVIAGPQFDDPGFDTFLLNTVSELGIHIVIPNMDRATVVLSCLKERLRQAGAWAVVSSEKLCRAMEDKLQADSWFDAHGIPRPYGDEYPVVAKERFGFGSRNQFIARNKEELAVLLSGRDRSTYFVQPYIEGQEYTVDAYVDRSGKVIAALSRKRLEVSGGEVEVSETLRHDGILELTRKVLAQPGWEGPICLQFIDSPRGPLIVEVNPRFGGGVTHAIHCGLDFPRWILQENTGRALTPFDDWPDGSLMTRARRDIFHDCADRS